MVPQRFVWPIVASVLGFALGGSVFWGAFGPNNTTSGSYYPGQSAENQGQQANAAAQNHAAGKTPATDCAESCKSGEKHEDKSEFWAAKLTDWLLAAFTFFLVLFTYRLWKSTENLWIETRDTSKRQEADTRILQRAYISVEPAGISASSTPDKCHPNIDIRNAGNLPAQNIKWVIDWATSQNHRRQTFHIDPDRLEGKNTLPPGALMRQGGPIIYIGKDYNELRNEIGLYLYIWGAVYYDDGFGIERVTKFCHRYNSVNLEEVFRTEFESEISFRSVLSGYQIFAQHARFHRFGNDAT